MSKNAKYMVLILQYKEENERAVEDLLRKVKTTIDAKYGKIWCPYKGFERRIVSALESVLELTESTQRD